jgi:hypothetical protein
LKRATGLGPLSIKDKPNPRKYDKNSEHLLGYDGDNKDISGLWLSQESLTKDKK